VVEGRIRQLVEKLLEVILLRDEVEDDEIKPGLFLLESVGLVLEELLVGFFLGAGSRGGESVPLEEVVARIGLLPTGRCRGLGFLFGAVLVATGLRLGRQGGGGATRGWRGRR